MGQIIKKIFYIFVVYREELPKKWWHRLVNVLIYGSTIIFATLILFISFSDSYWKKYSYTSYSFESNYSTAKGKEVDCYFYGYSRVAPSIDCGDLHNSTDFLNRYIKAISDSWLITSMRTSMTDDQLVNSMIRDGDIAKNIKVKRQTTILFRELFKGILITILIILGWLIFWESIIYRSLIYIICGRKTK